MVYARDETGRITRGLRDVEKRRGNIVSRGRAARLVIDDGEFVTLVRRMMRGEALTEDESDTLGDVVALEGVKRFPVRIKCALLSWTALEDALTGSHSA